jgi:hypothetical protein
MRNSAIFAPSYTAANSGTNEAMFAVNTATGKYYAVLFTDGKAFNAFGVASMRELPAPLLQWFQDKGGKL